MICPNEKCRHEIPDGSEFCPDCGRPIKRRNINSIQPPSILAFNNLVLEPTNYIKWKKPSVLKLFLMSLCTLVFAPVVWIIAPFTMYPVRKPSIRKIAEYVEKYKNNNTLFDRILRRDHQYVIFIKDGKAGLLDVTKYKVAIKATYLRISWREPNQYLNVDDGKECYVIDTYGNRLK